MITPYHAKLYAHKLSKRHSAAHAEKFAGTSLDAQVDINPHQIDAALFALKWPLSKGAILADEVGLDKTIEAGLVLAQKWTEGRRRILIITPPNLCRQWAQELEEKLFREKSGEKSGPETIFFSIKPVGIAQRILYESSSSSLS